MRTRRLEPGLRVEPHQQAPPRAASGVWEEGEDRFPDELVRAGAIQARCSSSARVSRSGRRTSRRRDTPACTPCTPGSGRSASRPTSLQAIFPSASPRIRSMRPRGESISSPRTRRSGRPAGRTRSARNRRASCVRRQDHCADVRVQGLRSRSGPKRRDFGLSTSDLAPHPQIPPTKRPGASRLSGSSRSLTLRISGMRRRRRSPDVHERPHLRRRSLEHERAAQPRHLLPRAARIAAAASTGSAGEAPKNPSPSVAYHAKRERGQRRDETRQDLAGQKLDVRRQRRELRPQRRRRAQLVVRLPEPARRRPHRGTSQAASPVPRRAAASRVALLGHAGAESLEAHRDVEAPVLAAQGDDRRRLELRLPDDRDERPYARRRPARQTSIVVSSSGSGCRRKVAVVMSPSVPSEPDHQLGEVEAGDVLHHLSAAAGERAVGADEGDADEQVADRAVARAARTEGVGRDDAADGLRSRAAAGRAPAAGRARRARPAARASVIPASTTAIWSEGACSTMRESRRSPRRRPGVPAERRARDRSRLRRRRVSLRRRTPAARSPRPPRRFRARRPSPATRRGSRLRGRGADGAGNAVIRARLARDLRRVRAVGARPVAAEPRRGEHLARVEARLRVEGAPHAPHRVQVRPRRTSPPCTGPCRPDAVLARDRPAVADADPQDLPAELLRGFLLPGNIRVVENQRMEVPVSRVEDVGHPQAGRGEPSRRSRAGPARSPTAG